MFLVKIISRGAGFPSPPVPLTRPLLPHDFSFPESARESRRAGTIEALPQILGHISVQRVDGRQSLPGIAFPGRAWERACVDNNAALSRPAIQRRYIPGAAPPELYGDRCDSGYDPHANRKQREPRTLVGNSLPAPAGL